MMLTRQAWTDHKFNLGIDPGWSYNILDRLADLHIRCEYHCRDLTDEQLSYRPGGKWSIKEHIGHLIALEEIHSIRVREIMQFREVLTGADMSNKKTHSANYNDSNIDDLLKELKQTRGDFIKLFESLDTACHQHEALHPRLKVIMKPVDLIFFVAEHDDHHLTSLLNIKREW